MLNCTTKYLDNFGWLFSSTLYRLLILSETVVNSINDVFNVAQIWTTHVRSCKRRSKSFTSSYHLLLSGPQTVEPSEKIDGQIWKWRRRVELCPLCSFSVFRPESSPKVRAGRRHRTQTTCPIRDIWSLTTFTLTILASYLLWRSGSRRLSWLGWSTENSPEEMVSSLLACSFI